MKNTDTGSVTFSIDGRTLLTRGGDDTVKCTFCDTFSRGTALNHHVLVWDVRAFKKPLAIHSGVTTLYPQTNAIFSPDEKYIVTGSGATIKGQRGKLIFLKRDTLEVERQVDMDNTVVRVVWHSKINQVRREEWIAQKTKVHATDSDGHGQWTNIRAILTVDVDQRCQAVGE